MAAAFTVACGGGGGGDGADENAAAAGDPPPPAAAARWRPALADTWHWQLKGAVDTRIDATVYDIDLFDSPPALIDELHARGRRVVCYFSAGSSEDWRPDFAAFDPATLGEPLDGWPGERWLDTRAASVRSLMRARLDLARSKGCDGVEPDNMDAYLNRPGFALDAQTQADYNRFIAREARSRGLAVGLKNDVDQLDLLVEEFDFAVNEQCHQYEECAGYAVFIERGKPVFNAEYRREWVDDVAEREMLCSRARGAGLRTLVLPLELDGSFRLACDD